MSTDTSKPRQPKRWTEEEDVILLEETRKQSASGNSKDWHQIAAKLPGRSNKDCRKRWVNAVCGGLNKGFWSDDEAQRLLEALEKYGPKWVAIAEQVGTRSADQCAKRWQHGLDPTYNRGSWTPKEDCILLKAVEEHGREWKYIQRNHLPNRAKNDVKNRYTVICRKDSIQSVPGQSQPSAEGPSDDYNSVSISDDESLAAEGDRPAGFGDQSPPSWNLRHSLADDSQTSSSNITDIDFSEFFNSTSQYEGLDFSSTTNDGAFQLLPITSATTSSGTTVATVRGKNTYPCSLSSVFSDGVLPTPAGISPSFVSEGKTGTVQPPLIPLDICSFGQSQSYATASSHQGDWEMQDGQQLSLGCVVSEAGHPASQHLRVTIDIEDCPRDTLDYIIDVTRPIKEGKVKIQIHMP